MNEYIYTYICIHVLLGLTPSKPPVYCPSQGLTRETVACVLVCSLHLKPYVCCPSQITAVSTPSNVGRRENGCNVVLTL